MKKTLLLILTFLVNLITFGQNEKLLDFEKIEASMKYEHGKIPFVTQKATLNVPKGFKFLDAKQTQYVLKDLWGNPEDTSILGALLPENNGVTFSNSWMFVITYQEDGHVEDDDANDINYDDLLKEMKKDTNEANTERKKAGYPAITLVGWASKPYYDNNLKVLHWAKELRFGNDKESTLNYDLRVLGRTGMFNVSAVAAINQLNEVKTTIPSVINSIQFNEGSKYSDFDSSTDNVAAWTIGGLVAGKVLAKAGFFAVIAKFGKAIILAIIAAFAGIKKFLFGKKEHEVSRPKEESNTNQDL